MLHSSHVGLILERFLVSVVFNVMFMGNLVVTVDQDIFKCYVFSGFDTFKVIGIL